MTGRRWIAVILGLLMVTSTATTAISGLSSDETAQHADVHVPANAPEPVQRLADSQAVADMLSSKLSEDNLTAVIHSYEDAKLAEITEKSTLPGLEPYISPDWSASGDTIRSLLLDNFDAHEGTFAFDTRYPVADRLNARMVLQALALHITKAPAEAKVTKALSQMARTGEVPADVELELLDDGNPALESKAPVDDLEAPVPQRTEAVPPEVNDEHEIRRVVDDCDNCGEVVNLTQPVFTSVDLGDVTERSLHEATLSVHAYDVDRPTGQPCGAPVERDEVHLNGEELGHLEGQDDAWSTTALTVPLSVLEDGVNTIEILPDTRGTACWETQIAWIGLHATTGDVATEADQDTNEMSSVPDSELDPEQLDPPEGTSDDRTIRGAITTSNTEDGTQRKFFLGDCPKCDEFLFRESSPIQATFQIDEIDPETIESATLDVRTFDVDWDNTACPDGPERDVVTINGENLGDDPSDAYVTGSNGEWSDTSFQINPDVFQSGENTISLHIDTLDTGCWAVTVDYFDLRLNGASGPLKIRDQTTDRSGYNLGDTVEVTTTIENTAEETKTAQFEWNLVRPDGNIVDTVTGPSAELAPGESAQRTSGITIPDNGDRGTWTVVGIARDGSNTISDREPTEIRVGSDLALAKDDLSIDILNTNENSNAAQIEVAGTFDFVSSFSEAKTVDVKYEIMEIPTAGSNGRLIASNPPRVVTTVTEQVDVPPSSSGSEDLPTVELDVELNSNQALNIAIDDGSDIQEIDETNNLVSIDDFGTPTIEEIKTRFDGDFLVDHPVPIPQRFTAKTEDPDVGAPVDRVEFELVDRDTGEVVHSATIENPSQPNHYGWEKPIWVLLEKGQYRVDATAFTENDVPSQTFPLRFSMFEPPDLAEIIFKLTEAAFDGSGEQGMTPIPEGGHIKYYRKTEWTMEFGLDQAPSQFTGSAYRQAINVIGELGLCLQPEGGFGAKFETEHSAKSHTSKWKSAATGKGFINLFGQEGEIAGGGSGEWTLVRGEWDLDQYGIHVSFKILFSCGVIDALIDILRLYVPGGAALATGLDWMKKTIGLSLVFKAGPKVKTDILLRPESPKVFGIPIHEVGFFGGTEHKVIASVGSKDVAEFGAEFTGDLGAKFALPNPGPIDLRQLGFCVFGCTAEAYASVNLGLTTVKHSFYKGTLADSGDLTCSSVSDCLNIVSSASTHADSAPGDTDLTGTVDTIRNANATEPSLVEDRRPVVSGLPTDRNGLALASTERGLVLLHDANNLDQPTTGVADIGQLSRTNGEWSNDGFAIASPRVDATPRVAVAEDGTRALAFQRIQDPIQAGDELLPRLDSTRILLATDDGDGFGQPVPVGGDEGYPARPRIDVGPTGDRGLVSWVEDLDGDLTPLERDWVVRAAPVVDGEPGEAITLTPEGRYPGAASVEVLPGGTALVAYTVTGEDDTRRVELRVGHLETGTFGDPVTIGEGHDATRPRIVADEGSVTVAWVETAGAQRLVERTVPYNPTAGVTATDLGHTEKRVVVPASAQETFNQVSATSDDTGQRLFAWTNLADEAVRSAVYDPKPYESTSTSFFAAQVETAVHADPIREPGTLLEGLYTSLDATYRASTDTLAVAASGPNGSTASVDVVEHSIGPNLEITELAADPANPAPGENANVTATITNEGERTAPPNQVVFTAENTVIGAGAVDPLAPGQSVDVRIPWNVPNATRSNEIDAYIDSHDASEDPDAGNHATQNVTLPDLRIATTSVEQGQASATLFASVENDGVLASEPSLVRFVDEDGDAVARAQLDGLEPGAATIADATVSVSSLDPETTQLKAVAELDDEFAPEDNQDAIDLELQPNLVVENVKARLDGEQVTITTTITNDGAIPSPPVNLTGRSDAGQHLLDDRVPGLAPDQTKQILTRIPAPDQRTQLTVRANPTHELAETSTVDNHGRVAFEPQTAPAPEVDAASIQYTSDGLRVNVHNEGTGQLGGEPFALYHGPPHDVDPYGRLYETRVDNLFTKSTVTLVKPQTTGHQHVDTTQLVTREGDAIGSLPADAQISLRLQPDRVQLEDATDDMIQKAPLVSVHSPTHPNPGHERFGSSGTFELAVAPGHTANGYSYALTDSPSTVPDTAADTTSSTLEIGGLHEGRQYLHVRAELGSGWTDTLHYPIDVAPSDDEPPTTNLVTGMPSTQPSEDRHVIAENVWVQLAAQDPKSGIERTVFSVDGGSQQVYDGRFTLPVGNHTVTFHSVDRAGNTEASRTVQVDVEPTTDRAAPKTTLATQPAPVDSPEGLALPPGATVTLDATDPYERQVAGPSGLEATHYRVDDGPLSTYDGPFQTPTTEGDHTITYFSVDQAGNTEAEHTFAFKTDTYDPVVQIDSPTQDAIVAGETHVSVQAGDDLSGIREVELFHEGRSLGFADETQPGVYNATIDTSTWAFGNNEITATARDNAGNTESDDVRVYAVSRGFVVPNPPQDALSQILYGPLDEEVNS